MEESQHVDVTLNTVLVRAEDESGESFYFNAALVMTIEAWPFDDDQPLTLLRMSSPDDTAFILRGTPDDINGKIREAHAASRQLVMDGEAVRVAERVLEN
ncbi:MAG: hypothetical protein IID17_12530 [Nitrospinae bacterium]|nr:hypothetical protein [Nitrospinota bacterium]